MNERFVSTRELLRQLDELRAANIALLERIVQRCEELTAPEFLDGEFRPSLVIRTRGYDTCGHIAQCTKPEHSGQPLLE